MTDRKPSTTDYRAFLPKLRAFAREKAGSIAVYGALFMTTAAGLAGVGLDMSVWYAMKREVQGTADAAAVAGAYVVIENLADVGDTITQAEYDDLVDDAALTEAERNGYTSGGTNTIVVDPVNISEGSGVVRRTNVTVTQAAPLYFASLFIDAVSVQAFAAAGTQTLGTQCVIALDETADKAVEFTGSTVANIGCGVASNSSSDEALYIGGSATLVANPAQAFGDIAIEGSGTLTSDFPPLPFSPRVDDPYADLVPPTPYDPGLSSCDSGAVSVANGETLTIGPMAPGNFEICGDISVANGGTLTLFPGNYEIGGDFNVNGTASVGTGNVNVEGEMTIGSGDSLTLGDGNYYIEGDLSVQGSLVMGNGEYVIDGTTTGAVFSNGASGTIDGTAGVLIYLTGDTPTTVATMNMNGNSDVDLVAYDTSSMPGVVVAQDPIAAENYGGPQDENNLINGGANGAINGSIYFPSQKVTFSGNADLDDACVQIVANKVTFTGNSFIENDAASCAALGVVINGVGSQLQVILVQ